MPVHNGANANLISTYNISVLTQSYVLSYPCCCNGKQTTIQHIINSTRLLIGLTKHLCLGLGTISTPWRDCFLHLFPPLSMVTYKMFICQWFQRQREYFPERQPTINIRFPHKSSRLYGGEMVLSTWLKVDKLCWMKGPGTRFGLCPFMRKVLTCTQGRTFRNTWLVVFL